MPPPNPLTRLRAVALDLGRFADELDATTDLDPAVLRYWRAQLLDIAAEFERLRPDLADDPPDAALS
jgi:hypothetical protein